MQCFIADGCENDRETGNMLTLDVHISKWFGDVGPIYLIETFRKYLWRIYHSIAFSDTAFSQKLSLQIYHIAHIYEW